MSSLPAYDEKALILQIAQGNEQAFAGLFNHYRPVIYHTAYRLTDSASTAEDVVQEVFLIIWLNRTTLPAIQHFRAYLMTIARNHIIRAFHRTAKLKSSISELTELRSFYHNDTADQVQANEYDRLLQQAIAQLPPRQAQVYVLTRQQGFTREQVATQLQVYPETVKTHLELAVKKIRAYCLARLIIGFFFIMDSPILLF